MKLSLRLLVPHLVFVCLAAPCARLAGEEPDPGLLSIDRIFDSGEFDAERFAGRWLEGGIGYTTLENAAGGGKDVVRHDPESGEREILVPAARLIPPGAAAPLAIDDYSWSRNFSRMLIFTNSKRVWRRNTRGDYWVLDRTSGELRQLGRNAPPSSLMFAKFSPDGERAAYVQGNNISIEDVRTGNVTALTADGSDRIINGTGDWVYEEELEVRDGFRFSPDGRWIAFWQLDTAGVREFPLINQSAGLYPAIRMVPYPKTGETNSACRIGIVPAASGPAQWARLPGDPRQHYAARIDWAPDSGELLIQQLNRLQNQNLVFAADPASGDVREVLAERDACWVDIHDPLLWIEGGKRFAWQSERDGWRHIYLASRAGGVPALATPGEFDVIDLLRIDEPGGWIYFIASPSNPAQRYLHRIRLDGSGFERLTPADQPGFHDYRLSPDGRWSIHTTSRFDTPPRTALIRMPGHEEKRALVSNDRLREKVAALRRAEGEFFRAAIDGGAGIDGWCLKPPGMDPARKYPLLVNVYGEPWGQTVLDQWQDRDKLWHLMMAQRGYAVMSFDNRGTKAPRGRAWRKSIYRQVGILASSDQAAALRRAMEERPWIDRKRIAIWGWSGGGSMALNAIFRHPDLYAAAMAVAPVPNMRLYDTIYQERYMGLPEDNVEGYLQGSPITFAGRLEGRLLLVHGTGDDNVHYQGTEALVNELIRLRKRFTCMSYPNRTHSISEGNGTTRHLYDLLTSFLEASLPAGPAD